MKKSVYKPTLRGGGGGGVVSSFLSSLKKQNKTISLGYYLCRIHFAQASINPTGSGNKLNFIEIDTNSCEKMDTTVFDFSYSCDLEWTSK